ncbi:MAG: hypothetical protein R6U32_02970 [Candidatus Woesearchaeota archaeon]
MVEFNPDGSLKLPARMEKRQKEKVQRMRTARCMIVRKEMTSFTAPKKCVLHLKLSETIKDSRFIDTIYSYFKENASTPTKLTKIDEKDFHVEIGTDFKRCSDCADLIRRYKEFLYGNLIEEKGNCPSMKGIKQEFCYEDHFE